MEYVINISEVSQQDISLVGAKGASLGELKRRGCPIPPGFVVTAAATTQFLESSGLTRLIQDYLRTIRKGMVTSLPASPEDLTYSITRSPLPRAIEKAILKNYRHLHSPVAVRSSTTAEDGIRKSFAGQHKTFLGLSGDQEVVTAIKGCIASLYSPEAISYSRYSSLVHSEIEIAVIVQQMVDAERSGIMFTANPVTGNTSEIVIESCFGLGEPIVSGTITPDHYVVEKQSGSVKNSTIANKQWGMFLNSSGPVRRTLPSDQGNKPCLEKEDIYNLATYGRSIEAHFGRPQDIEWAFDSGGLRILQSRPITTLEG